MRTIFALPVCYILLLASLCAFPDTGHSASAPKRVKLDGVKIAVMAPAGHSWFNKDTDIMLKMAPQKYQGLISHVLSLYSFDDTRKKPSRIYNNYCGIFYIGPEEKDWTPRDFSELKKYLMPHGVSGKNEPEAVAYMLTLVREGVDYDLPKRKGAQYFDYVQSARTVCDDPENLILSLRLKKPKEREKHVVFSLALVKGKVLGTIYYQVSANGDERERAIDATRSWQQALLAANK